MIVKSIRIFLPEGSPTGLLFAEIMNWTGKVLVAPQANLPELVSRWELQRPGVYMLAGPDPEHPGRDLIYIGEADEVKSRLLAHARDEGKDFWTRTIVVVSKDSNLTKGHVRYLESSLIALTQRAGRAALANKTAPPRDGLLPEPDQADMEAFLAQVELILPVLGFNFLRKAPSFAAPGEPPSVVAKESPLLEINTVGVSATAREVDGEFVVFAGSTARNKATPSWTSYRGLREQLVAEGRLVPADEPGFLVFTENVGFASPSAAAAVIYGGNQNGRRAWRLQQTGQTYKEWQDAELAAAAGPT
jgi:hypothetical protein